MQDPLCNLSNVEIVQSSQSSVINGYRESRVLRIPYNSTLDVREIGRVQKKKEVGQKPENSFLLA